MSKKAGPHHVERHPAGNAADEFLGITDDTRIESVVTTDKALNLSFAKYLSQDFKPAADTPFHGQDQGAADGDHIGRSEPIVISQSFVERCVQFRRNLHHVGEIPPISYSLGLQPQPFL